MADADSRQGQDQYGLRSSGKIHEGFITGANFAVRPVRYADVDGVAMFEGDIVLGTVEEMERFARQVRDDAVPFGVGITGAEFRWPGGVVPYRILDGVVNQQRILDAIAHWEANTKIRFPRRTDENAAEHPNFVSFRPGDGCSSRVGMQGGEQFITIGEKCSTGSIIHEIGHAVGLWHEQSREDRDSFITINWANIIDDNIHNFDQHITDGDDIGGYDYGSVMHYSTHAFSKNDEPTIVPKGGQTIGQRNGLSTGDIAAVRALYVNLEPTTHWAGVLFNQTVPANDLRAWFSLRWPSHWHVYFIAVPLTPSNDGGAQLITRVGAVRHAPGFLKYWFTIKNVSAQPVEFELRYYVLGWAGQ